MLAMGEGGNGVVFGRWRVLQVFGAGDIVSCRDIANAIDTAKVVGFRHDPRTSAVLFLCGRRSSCYLTPPT